MRRHSFFCLCSGVLSGVLLFLAFLLIGSNLLVTIILSAAWVVAWAALSISGGFHTTTGWFSFFPIFHFILFPLPLKVVMCSPVDHNLGAAVSTSLVMLLFFAGLFFAALLCGFLKIGARPVCSGRIDPGYYMSLAWICYVVGTLAYFFAHFGGLAEADNIAGGSGLANSVASFKDFSIAAYIFYTWRAGINVWKQPTFWLFFLSGISLGILTSTKTGSSQPIVYVLTATSVIYGLRSFKLLIGFALFAALFGSVIYPIMHYGRGVKGARGNSLAERLDVMGSITSNYFADPKFRKDMQEHVDDYAEAHNSYLPESTGVFDRFMMIANTDDLVAGVDQSSADARFHGLELFKLGLEILLPRFLYPEKPDVGSSEFLAQTAGIRLGSKRSNPVWGLPGQLYYSFGFPGVLFGSFVIELIFLVSVNFWFGNRVRASVWFCLLAVTMNMANSCAGIDSLPILMISLFVPAAALSLVASSLFLRSKR